MLGAIAGDVVGSVYEFRPTKRKDFQPLVHPAASFTDDTALTVAVADALLHARAAVGAFKDWERRYPDSGWRGRFAWWLFTGDRAPYGSFGNGAAMRVSPAGLLADTLAEALDLADAVARVTHDHPEGMKGAGAAAGAKRLRGRDSQRHLPRRRRGHGRRDLPCRRRGALRNAARTRGCGVAPTARRHARGPDGAVRARRRPSALAQRRVTGREPLA